MGGRTGRMGKPTVLKVLEGEKNKDRVRKDEPKPRPVSPTPPEHLDEHAKREWNRLGPILEDLGLLTEIDGASFAAYCELHSLSVRISTEIEKNSGRLMLMKMTFDKKGNKIIEEYPNPLIDKKLNVLSQMKRFLTEFGLSPASRTKISVQTNGRLDDYAALID